ncbi:MAG: DUF92 domain-containing protein [Thermoplasmata archaeon]
MLALLPALVASLVTVALALGSVLARALTPAAGAVATAFGIVIVVTAGFAFLALLILFVVASVIVTRYRIDDKRKQNLQEGRGGERGVANVVAHIIVPTGLAIGAGWMPPLWSIPTTSVLYISALAFGASDTFASELGVLAGHARSILTFRPVTPGTNGGISGAGELWGLFGALTTGVIGYLVCLLFGTPTLSAVVVVGISTAAGFAACQIDSVLGEAFENRGYLNKHSTNFLGMISAVAIAAACLTAGGFLR